jgi:hypothetical protein
MDTWRLPQVTELPGEEEVGITMVAVTVGWGNGVAVEGERAALPARKQAVVSRINTKARIGNVFFMEASKSIQFSYAG